MATKRPAAVLLDRDGTINVKPPEGEYVTRADELRLLPGAAEAIRMLNAAGIPVVIVTNQRGIALGQMTESDLHAVHARLAHLLALSGARVDEVFYCPHEKGTCACRKPGTLLLERARDRLGLRSLERVVMIGDSLIDVQAGRAAGARTVLLRADGAASGDADEVAGALLDAVRRTLRADAVPSRHPGSS